MLSQKVEAATSATRGKSVGRMRVRVGIVVVCCGVVWCGVVWCGGWCKGVRV
jgi:hypothetical protein